VSDYYAELGVTEEASTAELRQAYRRRARALHPDVNRDGHADEDMGRLNEAWRVLRNPRTRRRYDDARSAGTVDPEVRTAPAHRFRPSLWLVVLGVLAAIFVITAYAAGPAPVTPVSPPQSDRCLAHLPGYDAFVSCSQPNIGRVVAELPGGPALAACPAGSAPQPFLGRAETVCLEVRR
jgi:DnaJ domain